MAPAKRKRFELSDEQKVEIRRLYLHGPETQFAGAKTFAKAVKKKSDLLKDAPRTAIQDYLESRFPYAAHKQTRVHSRYVTHRHFDYWHKLGGQVC